MKCLRFLVVFILLLQGLASKGLNAPSSALDCPLPAPAWINATAITSSSIAIAWADVPGATHYKVSRFDVTHGVALPDAYTVEPEYTSEPHDPATVISFDVSATSCGEPGPYGGPINGEYITSYIVVDDIASFSAPNPPTGNQIVPANSNSAPFTVVNAEVDESTVSVLRSKVSVTDNKGTHWAEVLVWSHCADPDNAVLRVKYWGQSLGVTHTENQANATPNQLSSITFNVGAQPFFTLLLPTLTFPTNEEEPITGTITIHNDRSLGNYSSISIARAYSIEGNPCNPPRRPGDAYMLAPSDESGLLDRGANDIQFGMGNVSVRPNPCVESTQVHYNLDATSVVRFTFFDNTGREIKTIQLPPLDAGSYDTVINTSDLPSGLYHLAVQTDKERNLVAVFIQK